MTKKTPEKKPITWESALESLRNLVARRGENFVYQKPPQSTKCTNFNPGNYKPSCAVGVVLYDHGYRYKDMKSSYTGLYEYNDHGIFTVAGHLGIKDGMDGDLKEALANFQAAQDCARPYGECLTKFENAYHQWRAKNG